MNRFFSTILVSLLFGLLTASTPPSRTADALLGRWYVPSRQSSIEFFRTGDRYFARIVEVGGAWQQNYANAKGKIIISNLHFTGHEWSGGELIHPGTNARFDLSLTLKDARSATAVAYKGIRLLHRDFVLIREQPEGDALVSRP